MSGIYIHIPLCRSRCEYCDFYSEIAIDKKGDLVKTLCQEVKDKRNYLKNKKADTIYFGGGTPSLLGIDEINLIIESIKFNTGKPIKYWNTIFQQQKFKVFKQKA